MPPHTGIMNMSYPGTLYTCQCVCVCVCAHACVCAALCFHPGEQRMCCYIVMKGASLSLPGTLIASAHVTPFNNPESPPVSPLISKTQDQRDKECVFVFVCVYRMKCLKEREKCGM